MISFGNIDTQLKLMYGNILNMIIFDKFKTGNTMYDTLITTIIITFISYLQSLLIAFFR